MSNRILVDWGTTNFRAYLVDQGGALVAAVTSDEGVRSAAGRFADILGHHLKPWLVDHRIDSILCAGMVGSDLGWCEVDMVGCPAGAPELARRLHPISVPGLPPLHIVPGVCCAGVNGAIGMMRGEEVLLFGCLSLRGVDQGRFCFPGTHSKWVTVRDRAICAIETCMTGETFALFRMHSVLSRSMEGWNGDISEVDFLAGVEASRIVPNPLRSAFSVRAQHLLGRLPTAAARSSYLSGLLIGAEVASFAEDGRGEDPTLTIACEPRLAGLYDLACQRFGIDATCLEEQSCFVAGASAIITAAA